MEAILLYRDEGLGFRVRGQVSGFRVRGTEQVV